MFKKAPGMKLFKWLFGKQKIKRGKWSSLTKEERLRAKALMYGARAGSASHGGVELLTVTKQK